MKQVHERRIAISACILIACVPRLAEAEPDSSSFLEAYFSELIASEPGPAFDKLMQHSRVDEMKPREIALAKGQIEQALVLYGKPTGYELISYQLYGSSIIRYIYVTKHADVPLVWNFVLYKPKGDWQILNFDFNDQVKNLH